ncbi:hypothetical protein [Parasediminibacterium sp. JCM 36343]|uniref:hypothetical protein n=1 Tax=Parasediminibacterium sp. JCM 36343 TaxID=3374279 RepID=UPI003979DB50
MGVFNPAEEWAVIKANYTDIDTLDQYIPEWQKQLLDSRLLALAQNPDSLKPMSELFEELNTE